MAATKEKWPEHLELPIARAVERTAIAVARLRGRGDELAADRAAVHAMQRELGRLAMQGSVVIGEGERDEAPMLYVGEKLGLGRNSDPKLDIAVDPLEGTALCAANMPGALSALAIAESGSLLLAPDVYMEKIAIGPSYPKGIIDLDMTPSEIILTLAKAKGVKPSDITALVLHRTRHADMIAELRNAGAAVRLVIDGDISGIIQTCDPVNTGIDVYMGIGGAPEGLLAAAALRAIGGQMQGRLVLDTKEKRVHAENLGIKDPRAKYTVADMVRGNCLFIATGITDSSMLRGVRFHPQRIETETVLMRSITGTVRWMRAEHLSEESSSRIDSIEDNVIDN